MPTLESVVLDPIATYQGKQIVCDHSYSPHRIDTSPFNCRPSNLAWRHSSEPSHSGCKARFNQIRGCYTRYAPHLHSNSWETMQLSLGLSHSQICKDASHGQDHQQLNIFLPSKTENPHFTHPAATFIWPMLGVQNLNRPQKHHLHGCPLSPPSNSRTSKKILHKVCPSHSYHQETSSSRFL